TARRSTTPRPARAPTTCASTRSAPTARGATPSGWTRRAGRAHRRRGALLLLLRRLLLLAGGLLHRPAEPLDRLDRRALRLRVLPAHQAEVAAERADGALAGVVGPARHAEIPPRVGHGRVELHRLLVGRDRLVVQLLGPVDHAEVEVVVGHLAVELDRALEHLLGGGDLPGHAEREAQVVGDLIVVAPEAVGAAQVGDGSLVVTLLPLDGAEVGLHIGVVRVELAGPLEGGDRLVDAAGPVVGHAEVGPQDRLLGPEAGRLLVGVHRPGVVLLQLVEAAERGPGQGV